MYILLQIIWLVFGNVRHVYERLNVLLGVRSGTTFRNYPAPHHLGLCIASVSKGITVSGFAELLRSNNTYFSCVCCLAVL